MAIDLHTHSTASDGSLRPAALVQQAHEAGLSAVALTDHDTSAGLEEAVQAGKDLGIEVIPGCELSVVSPAAKMHILGLWLPVKPLGLMDSLEKLNRLRHERNVVIVEKLQKLGIDITYEEVKERAGEGSVGRPHIAGILFDKGYVTSIQESFTRFLGPRGKAYMPKTVLSAAEAVGLLKQEGATVMMAHPFLNGLNLDQVASECIRLREYGMDGLEAYYTEHSPSQQQGLLQLASRLEMQVSGGSDFHGTPKPSIRLGVGKGGLSIPDSVLDTLKAHRAAQGLQV